MKVLSLFIASALLLFSCASSQTATSAEVKRKIDDLRTLLQLSPEQAQKLSAIESSYAGKSAKLDSGQKNYEEDLTRLNNKRTDAYKKVLSREQFIKFVTIDKNLMQQQPPVRFTR